MLSFSNKKVRFPKRWLGTESNRRHRDFQSPALPTELPSLRLGEFGRARKLDEVSAGDKGKIDSSEHRSWASGGGHGIEFSFACSSLLRGGCAGLAGSARCARPSKQCRHRDFQSPALPTELQSPRLSEFGRAPKLVDVSAGDKGKIDSSEHRSGTPFAPFLQSSPTALLQLFVPYGTGVF